MQHDTDSASRLERENDHLAAALAALEERMPSDEEIAYLRNRKVQDERANWVWQTVRQYAPWVLAIGSALSTGLYWLLTHTITIGQKP